MEGRRLGWREQGNEEVKVLRNEGGVEQVIKEESGDEVNKKSGN